MNGGAADVLRKLDLLVAGMTGLKGDGRIDEPNLDGSPGDYVGFTSWEWPQGVGLYGLFRLWEFRGDDALRRLIEDWYALRLATGLPPINVNTSAPMLALSLLWARTADARWQPALAAWADHVVADLPRTPEAGFQHIVSDGVNAGELWDDTLFMLVLPLAAYGRASGRHDLIEEAVRQFLLHAKYLTDTETGLWFHGWTFAGRHHFARARWARGNAWITAGILDFLDIVDLRGGVRDFLLDCLAAQMNALAALQDESGGWHTLLDDPSSYLETSATAGIAYGFLKAARLGLVEPQFREVGLRGLAYVLARIDGDGIVQGVSYGTRMGRDLQFYRDIPMRPTAYGQALAMLLLAEAVRHLETA
jgi:unsaturated rhamnogalacturonyl hydrolase